MNYVEILLGLSIVFKQSVVFKPFKFKQTKFYCIYYKVVLYYANMKSKLILRNTKYLKINISNTYEKKSSKKTPV